MKSRKMLCLAVVLMFGMLLVSGCSGGGGEKNVTLKVGGIQSAEDTATLAMQKMADLAKEKSGGTLNIQVFAASQLGNATSQVEAVSIGSQDMFVDTGSWISTFVPEKSIESMFFMFSSEEHYKKFLSSDINKGFEEKFRTGKGIRVIANDWIRAPRSIASKVPITNAAGMKDLKIRVPDIKAYLESTKALESKPTQIAWGETYLALVQGVVDACEGPMDNLYTMKFYEATKNIVVTEHIRDNIVVLINDKKYEKLSQKQKDALTAAAKEAGVWYTAEVKKNLDEKINLMKKDGTNFVTVDTAEFAAKIESAIADLEKSGALTPGLYAKIKALK